MSDDVIEIPEHRCLYRQSSVEVHLTPEPPDMSSDSDEEDLATPKIIGGIPKTPDTERSMSASSNMVDELKMKMERRITNYDSPQSDGKWTPKYAEIEARKVPSTYYPERENNSCVYAKIANKSNTAKPDIAIKPNKQKPNTSDGQCTPKYAELEARKVSSTYYPERENDSCVYAELVNKSNFDKPDIAIKPNRVLQNQIIQEELKQKLKNCQINPKTSTTGEIINHQQNKQNVIPRNDIGDVNPIYAEIQKKAPILDNFNTGVDNERRYSAAPVYPQAIKKNKSSNPENDLSQTTSVMSTNHNNSETTAFPPERNIPKDIGDIKTFDTTGKMATLRPKSPRPPVVKPEKEESLWDKLGTLGRKKRIKEVKEVEAEGKNAIDSPGNPVTPDYPPEEYELDENEERCMVNQQSLEQPKVKDLIQILIDWINDELAEQRIIVQDIVEDLYDGQVLQKLLEKLTGDKLNEPEVTQSEAGQRHKLAMVLDDFNRVLGLQHQAPKKWGVEAIHSKNIVSILYLLVALARHFRAPIRMPEHVTIVTHVVQKSKGQLIHRTVHEHVTSAYDDVGMLCERDAFDTLFDHAPDKLQVVKKSMVTFVNKHLNKINLEVTDLDNQFSDGVYLVLLMGLLEGFFVPLHCFFLTPRDFDQMVHNVAFAFELMEEVGISRPKARPKDIVNLDLKSTLRVLYKLFTKYRDII